MNLRTAGSSTARSADILDRRRRSLAPLVIVTVAALVFAILLILVRLQWAPLESADHGAAADINSLVAGNATLVAVVKAITWLGSSGVLWTVIGAATVILALRRQWRLAAYLLVTGAGALTFGLVSVPVELYSATEAHGPVFHQFEKGTADRIRYQRVNERTTVTPTPTGLTT